VKILLADDARFFLAIEKQFLRKTPAEVFEARSSDETLAMIRQHRPGLVYMAYTLLPNGGPECCRRIKQDPACKATPVVMICDAGDEQQSELSRRAGCSAIITKPLDQHAFLQIGRQFLDEIREPRQTCLFQVQFTWQGENERAKCLDISSGGLFVDSQADIPVGEVLSITFKLPNQELSLLSVQGEVAWHNRRPNLLKPHYPVGFGIKFINLRSDDRARLAGLSRR